MILNIVSILSLVIAAVVPALFWFKGRRMFGSGTHPAALFILAWMAVAVLMFYTKWTETIACAGSCVWVALNFFACYIVQQMKAKSEAGSSNETDEDEENIE